MLEDMINPPELQQQISLEGISSPISSQNLDFHDEDGIDFFADDLHHASDIITTTTTTTTAASCDNEGLCYIDDDASFDFNPATISSLLNPYQHSDYEQQDVTYQLSETYQNQDQLHQLLLNYTITGSIWPVESPVSVTPPDTDDVTRPGRRPWPWYNSESMLPIPEGQLVQIMGPSVGYMGIDTLPACTFLDNSILSRYQPIMSGEDGQMGFFHGRMMMGGEVGMGAQDDGVGGVYRPEAGQRLYRSIDMQVMGDYTSLVDGHNSNPTALSTSDITPLDDSTTKVGRLSPEERKEKIDRYLKKRTERNFNKKIKYACRKTLADSRPRVRGRFAKNDEHGEGATLPCTSNHDYYDEEEVLVKEEQDMLNTSDILAHISGVDSFNYNYTLESWI